MCIRDRFTADAAHEMRIPTSALRAQAQVALGAAADVALLSVVIRILADNAVTSFWTPAWRVGRRLASQLP